jgi:flagellar basal body-associated protein FliL
MSKWLNEKIKKHKKIIVVSLISVGVTALVGGILSYILK